MKNRNFAIKTVSSFVFSCWVRLVAWLAGWLPGWFILFSGGDGAFLHPLLRIEHIISQWKRPLGVFQNAATADRSRVFDLKYQGHLFPALAVPVPGLVPQDHSFGTDCPFLSWSTKTTRSLTVPIPGLKHKDHSFTDYPSLS